MNDTKGREAPKRTSNQAMGEIQYHLYRAFRHGVIIDDHINIRLDHDFNLDLLESELALASMNIREFKALKALEAQEAAHVI